MILVLVDHDRGVLDPLSTRALTAARGIDSDIKWNNEGSFHKDEFKDTPNIIRNFNTKKMHKLGYNIEYTYYEIINKLT